MRAVTYFKFGPAKDVLSVQKIETPTPGPGEVLVELALSGVNPSDVKARAGTRPGVTKPAFPEIIPHSDGAGTIAAVGSGVDASRIGQRVWLWNAQWQRPFGSAASHIVLPSAQAVDMPEEMTFETGAQLGIPGLTAAHTVFASGDVRGKTVLVQGAGGTVGYLALQLAKWGGARVIATARGTDMQRAKDAGADAVIDFSTPDQAQQIIDVAGPVDHIVEVEYGLNADTDAAVVAENGSICAYGSALDMAPVMPFGAMLFKAATLQVALIYLLPTEPRNTAIKQLHDAHRDGALACPVAEVFTLDTCAAAHEAVETGKRTGGILITCT